MRKRRDAPADAPSQVSVPEYRRGQVEVELGPDSRRHRDGRSYEARDEQRGAPVGTAAAAAAASSRLPTDRVPVDPFRYQVHDDDAFSAPEPAPPRPLTPTVVTVDREPNFDDVNWSPATSKPEPTRLSRKDSFELERMAEDQETGHRGVAQTERRDDPSDEVQEEANRFYREAALARKIAEDQVRSHAHEPDRSVVDRWDEHDGSGDVAVVPPPEAQGRRPRKAKSPYAAPDADVRIDNKIYPQDIDRFRSETGLDAPVFKSRDPSCERDRPLLNLVFPTPEPSRQATPSPEPAARGTEGGEHVEPAHPPEPASSVVSASRGEGTRPSTPKSVTWGENSTKRFEVESPEPRSDAEYVRDVAGSEERPRPLLNQASQWGAIAAALAGSSTEPDNEPGAEGSDKSLPPSTVRAGPDAVILADEPGAAPPVPGPKPTGPGSGQMPGGFADDLEFAATLAAGLKDTGFDPNIVIDDPVYHRRDSPPGESGPNGDDWNRRAYSDIVVNLSRDDGGGPGERPAVSEPGFVIGEVETPKDESVQTSSAANDEWGQVPATKVSKKERRRLEKLRRQSSEASGPIATESSETTALEDAADSTHGLSKKEQRKHDRDAKIQAWQHYDDEQPQSREVAEEPGQAPPPPDAEPEAAWAETGRKKSKKHRKSRDFDNDDADAQSKVSVPTDAFDDLQALRSGTRDDDDWEALNLPSKKESKRDKGRVDSPTRSAAASEVSAASSSKRSSKSKRRSIGIDDDFVDPGDDPPGRRRRHPIEDRDVSSVVSEPRYDERKRERREGRRSSRHRGDDDDDAKSVASAPGSSRKGKEPEKRSSGLFSSIFKSSGGGKDEQPKKESFLDNAGTSGAGVGLATVAAAATGPAPPNATDDDVSDEERDLAEPHATRRRDLDFLLDPEIAPRAFKPAIDPQYGDLLPLPPSEPGTPQEDLPEQLPGLPDSRPDTPPDERNRRRDYPSTHHRRRRSAQETPVKSPSTTAIPISLRLGQRGTPTAPSPGPFRAHAAESPTTQLSDAAASRRQARRISWDNSREMMPLYLLEHSRNYSADSVHRHTDLPALPSSGPPSSRESPAPEPRGADDDAADIVDRGLSARDLAGSGLRIDTSVAPSAVDRDLAGSQETTPRAGSRPDLPGLPASAHGGGARDHRHEYVEPDPVESMSKDRSSFLLYSAPSSVESGKTADREGVARSPGEPPSPTARLRVVAATGPTDKLEDLTSADEHFSDALEGQSEDAFEEAVDLPALEAPEDRRLDERPVADAPVAAAAAAAAAAASETEEAEPDEWKSMTAKERKKAKKARKNRDVAAAAAAAGATAAAVASCLAGSQSTSNADSTASQPETSHGGLTQPRKGKKSRKNKRKGFDEDGDPGETTTQPCEDASSAVPPPEGTGDELSKDDASSAGREVVLPELSDEAAALPHSSDKDIGQGPAPGVVEGVEDAGAILAGDDGPDMAHPSHASADHWVQPSESVERQEAAEPASAFDEMIDPKPVGETGDGSHDDASQDPTPRPVAPETEVTKSEPESGGPAAVEAGSDEVWSSTAGSKKGRNKKKAKKQRKKEEEPGGRSRMADEEPEASDKRSAAPSDVAAGKADGLPPVLDMSGEMGEESAEGVAEAVVPDAAAVVDLTPLDESLDAVGAVLDTSGEIKAGEMGEESAEGVTEAAVPDAAAVVDLAPLDESLDAVGGDVAETEATADDRAAEGLAAADAIGEVEKEAPVDETAEADQEDLARKAPEIIANEAGDGALLVDDMSGAVMKAEEPHLEPEVAGADESLDTLAPTQEAPEATQEEALTKEHEALALAAQSAANALADDVGATPAAAEREVTDTRDGTDAEVQGVDRELAAELQAEETTIPDQDEPAASLATGEVAEDVPATAAPDAPASPVAPSAVEPEEAWTVPTKSKKDKRKKKKRGQGLDEAQPESTSAPHEPVSAPSARDKKKKKKDKRKTVQWEPQEPETAPEARPESVGSPPLDVDVAADPELPAEQASVESTTRQTDYFPSSSSLHAPRAEAKDLSADSEPLPTASFLPSAPAYASMASVVTAALEHERSKPGDEAEQQEFGEKTASGVPEITPAAEVPEEAGSRDVQQDASPQGALEPVISEQRPSEKDDVPVQGTSETIPSEPPRADASTSEVAESTDATVLHADEGFTAPKKKGKKGKKSGRASMWEARKEEAVPKPDPEPAMPTEDNAAAAEKRGLDGIAETVDQASLDAPPDDPASIAHSADARSEAAPGGIESPELEPADRTTESQPIVEAAPQDQEPPAFEEEAISTEGPSVSATTDQSGEVSTATEEWPQPMGKKGGKNKKKKRHSFPAVPAPIVETPEAADTTDAMADLDTDFGLPKSGKKNKKKQKPASWEAVPADAPPSPDVESRQPPEAPNEPLDGESVLEPEAQPVPSGGDAQRAPEEGEQSRAGADVEQGAGQPKDEAEPGPVPEPLTVDATPLPEGEEAGTADATVTEAGEPTAPAKTSKKDKRRKKKQAAAEEAVQVPPGLQGTPEKAEARLDVVDMEGGGLDSREGEGAAEAGTGRSVDEPEASTSAAAEPAASGEAVSEQPVGTDGQEAEANPVDDWGGFSLKKSRKDKKKKKRAKDTEPEKPQEPETATPLPDPDPDPDRLGPPADLADQATEPRGAPESRDASGADPPREAEAVAAPDTVASGEVVGEGPVAEETEPGSVPSETVPEVVAGKTAELAPTPEVEPPAPVDDVAVVEELDVLPGLEPELVPVTVDAGAAEELDPRRKTDLEPPGEEGPPPESMSADGPEPTAEAQFVPLPDDVAEDAASALETEGLGSGLGGAAEETLPPVDSAPGPQPALVDGRRDAPEESALPLEKLVAEEGGEHGDEKVDELEKSSRPEREGPDDAEQARADEKIDELEKPLEPEPMSAGGKDAAVPEEPEELELPPETGLEVSARDGLPSDDAVVDKLEIQVPEADPASGANLNHSPEVAEPEEANGPDSAPKTLPELLDGGSLPEDTIVDEPARQSTETEDVIARELSSLGEGAAPPPGSGLLESGLGPASLPAAEKEGLVEGDAPPESTKRKESESRAEADESFGRSASEQETTEVETSGLKGAAEAQPREVEAIQEPEPASQATGDELGSSAPSRRASKKKKKKAKGNTGPQDDSPRAQASPPAAEASTAEQAPDVSGAGDDAAIDRPPAPAAEHDPTARDPQPLPPAGAVADGPAADANEKPEEVVVAGPGTPEESFLREGSSTVQPLESVEDYSSTAKVSGGEASAPKEQSPDGEWSVSAAGKKGKKGKKKRRGQPEMPSWEEAVVKAEGDDVPHAVGPPPESASAFAEQPSAVPETTARSGDESVKVVEPALVTDESTTRAVEPLEQPSAVPETTARSGDESVKVVEPTLVTDESTARAVEPLEQPSAVPETTAKSGDESVKVVEPALVTDESTTRAVGLPLESATASIEQPSAVPETTTKSGDKPTEVAELTLITDESTTQVDSQQAEHPAEQEPTQAKEPFTPDQGVVAAEEEEKLPAPADEGQDESGSHKWSSKKLSTDESTTQVDSQQVEHPAEQEPTQAKEPFTRDQGVGAAEEEEKLPAPADEGQDESSSHNWSSKKLSKQERKRRKKQASLIEPAREAAPGDPAHDEPLLAAESNDASAAPAQKDKDEDKDVLHLADPVDAPSVAQEDKEETPVSDGSNQQQAQEDFVPTKKSKKDKKKAQRAAALAAAGLAATGMAVGSGSTADDRTVEPTEEPRHPEPTRSWADEVEEEVLQTESQATQEKGQSGLETPFENPEGEDKSKAQAGVEGLRAVESDQPLESTVPLDTTATEIQEAVEGDDAAGDADTAETAPSSQAPEVSAATTEAEGEWAVTGGRKGKKKRKGKAGGTTTPAVEETKGPAEPEPVPELEPVPVPVPVREPDVGDGEPGGRSVEAVAGNELSTDTPAKPEEQEPTKPERETDAVEESYTWAFPTKKKKGKKGKSGKGVATPGTESETPVETKPIPDEGDITAQALDTADAARPGHDTEEPTAEAREPSQATETTADESILTVKKDEKGQNRKASKTIPPSGPELSDQPTAADVSAGEARDLTFATREADAPLAEQPSSAGDQELPSTAQQPENAWATSKKKKGKGKKNKGSKLSTFDWSEPPTREIDAPGEALAGPDAAGHLGEEPAGKEAVVSESQEEPMDSGGHVPEAKMDVERSPVSTDDVKPAEEKSTAADVVATEPAPAGDVLGEACQSVALPGPGQPDFTGREELPARPSEDALEDFPMADVVDVEMKDRRAGDEELDFTSKPKDDDHHALDAHVPAPAAPQVSEDPPASEIPVEAAADEPAEQPAVGFAPRHMEDVAEPSPDVSTHVQTSAGGLGDAEESNARLEPDQGVPSAEKSGTGSGEEAEKGKVDEGSGPSTAEAVAAAGTTVAGGVALLAEKFGGSKKKKKKGKAKSIDRRQPREEDIFDDPALWEGADKKGLQAEGGTSMDEAFWGDGEEAIESSRPRGVSESWTESEGGWQEIARQGAPLEEDLAESPGSCAEDPRWRSRWVAC
ncbi:hypothetical protein CDD83_9411 [Cordyceps sp. RAO-2017]|nr:hypothetical protein CDD83_9411 [Cordyceps sp. RAO-2017]